MGRLMWSEYFLMIVRSRKPFSRSSSPSRRCSTIVVPRDGCSAVSSVYAPRPSDSHRTPSAAVRPSRRVVSVTRSATMNEE